MRGWLRAVGICAMLSMCVPVCFAGSEPFAPPRADELAMKEVPGYPGVAAVVLYRERIDNRQAANVTIYERIKVLNEEGKKYANVVLGYRSSSMFSRSSDFDSAVKDISARTIHPDGKIVPFAGKPYEQDVEKVKGEKTKQKVFTLPDVEVGSILEYRYTKQYQYLSAPDWIVQGDLFVKAAHYEWISGYVAGYSTTWFPVLPTGANLVKNPANTQFDLNLTDVPPLPTDDYLPPSSSFVYRVMFNFIRETSGEAYWKNTGDAWSKGVNEFLHTNSDMKSKVKELTSGTVTQDEALRNIYSFVMTLENTSYTRDYDKKEEKAHGKRDVNNVADIFTNKRGNAFSMTMMLIAMARLAGLKAYAMLVPDRADDLFLKGWLTFQQFDTAIALINVDGKDMYFAPGVADCPYGQLPWQYTMMTGLRQTDSGSAFATTPSTLFNRNKEERVGDITMDASGAAEGSVTVTFYGAPALSWRHSARLGDDESFRKDLKESLEGDLPKGFEAKVTDISQLAEYEKPLIVKFHVQGPVAAKAGKRLLVPADLFEAGTTTTFSKPTRQFPVYFHYPETVAEAVRIKFPENMTVENVPVKMDLKFNGMAAYMLDTTPAASSFITQRNYSSAMVIVPADQYKGIRDFFTQFEANDQESVVLKLAQSN